MMSEQNAGLKAIQDPSWLRRETMGRFQLLTIDCDYLRPEFAAAYLLHDGQQAVFIEVNTTHAVPRLLDALHREGLTPSQVSWILVTHIHLDHAGGTAALAAACPRARIGAHPRAVPHLVDPTKLVASARAVYGEERFRVLYGEIAPIAPGRVKAFEDEASLKLASDWHFRFLHTRGHANHHFCILHEETRSVFTGDSFGVAYPALVARGAHTVPFVFPSTSPTDFDAEEALRTVDRIEKLGARAAYPTHFGALMEIGSAASQLRMSLQFSTQLLKEVSGAGFPHEQIEAHCQHEWESHLKVRLRTHGLNPEVVWEWVALDAELNAAGIAFRALKSKLPPGPMKP